MEEKEITPENQTSIKVGGMTCAACVKTIENTLTKLDGVSDVNVSLGNERAYITYDSQTVSDKAFKKTVKKAVTKAGYDYLGWGDEDTSQAEEKAMEASLASKKNRFIIGFAVSLPLMAMMYLDIMPPGGISMPYFMLAITIIPFIYTSQPIFRHGLMALQNRNLDMNVMYSMGIGVAYGSSLLGTFEIVLTPDFMFYEAALMLAAFLMLGKYMEEGAKGKTSQAIKTLMGLRAKTATVIRDGQEMELAIEDVIIGDIIIVKPGEKIPVDGTVVGGESYVDESMISGEPVPVLKGTGNDVIGGTINKNSVLRIEARKIGKDTVLAQIIQMVDDAQSSKPDVQRLADKAVTWFIPVVLSIAIIAAGIWYAYDNDLLNALTVLISILVIACPCALGLATPTAVTVGLGRGAELGILIRRGEALETSGRLTTVLFDKTGTLTKGEPVVTDIIPFDIDEKKLLEYTASVEKNSQHPLAEAVVNAASERGIPLKEVSDFDTLGGKGVKAKLGNEEVHIGTRSFIKASGTAISDDIEGRMGELEAQGKTAIMVAIDGRIAGLMAIADQIKPTTKAAIESLGRMGLEVGMVTGDNKRTAHAIASQIGITTVLAEVLPGDKARKVKELQDKGEVVAFVGDGINDAPALAQADVGIAIGRGTDVAKESSDIVLMKSDLMDVVGGIQLSRKVMTRIKQNLFWAFAYNSALIPVAAGVLVPLADFHFRPEFAGLAMAMSSVTVVSLSLMLRKYQPK